MKRRDFLKAGSASAISLGLMPLAFSLSPSMALSNRRLILVELTGGNDGLSMVIPRGNKELKLLRPTLQIADQVLAPLNENFGLHPNLASLVPFFKQGKVAIVNNVGYQPSNRSHFRSLDIWHSGVSDRIETQRGWLGRQLASEKKKYSAHKMSLFHLGSGPLPLCFGGSPHPVTALRSLNDLKFSGKEEVLQKIVDSAKKKKEDSSDIAFLKESTQSALEAAKKCDGIKANGTSLFSNDPFGKQLSLVSSLSTAFGGDQIYFTNISGFDTHAVQNETQPILLASLARGLSALMKTLTKTEAAATTILVYSEFGRRVKENASRGTDHGAAGPCLILGNQVKGGIYGGSIDLKNLSDGDLRPKIDFRSVYADLVGGALRMSTSTLKPEFGPKLELIRRK
ncbi:MAG: hypothetical protein ACI97A_001683 [Planctomycetota bacterium]|jgi:uncharacterized protein (DUF1501 family)